jgi:hypothetical protein
VRRLPFTPPSLSSVLWGSLLADLRENSSADNLKGNPRITSRPFIEGPVRLPAIKALEVVGDRSHHQPCLGPSGYTPMLRLRALGGLLMSNPAHHRADVCLSGKAIASRVVGSPITWPSTGNSKAPSSTRREGQDHRTETLVSCGWEKSNREWG